MTGWRDLSFRWKLGLPLLALTAVFAGSLLLARALLVEMTGDAQQFAREYMPGLSLILEADRDLHQALIAQQRLADTEPGSDAYGSLRESYADNLAQARERVAEAAEALAHDRTTELAEAFARDLTRWDQAARQAVGALQGGDPARFRELMGGQGRPAFDAAREHLDVMTGLVNGYAQELSGEVARDVSVNSTILLAAIAVGLAVCVFMAVAIPNLVLRPLAAMRRRVADLASGGGDLTVRLNNPAGDEIGRLSGEIDGFLEMLRGMLAQIDQNTRQVAAAAEELSQTSSESEANVDAQRSASDQVSTATNELASTIQEVARNINDAAEAAAGASEEARNGQRNMDATVTSIETLAEGVASGATTVQGLEGDTENIGTVLDVIRGVAEQTNLLALNAAIEAARAGQHGRGFAVVADEVRTLATRTQQSTEEIRDIIERLQQGARDSAAVMRQEQERARETVDKARDCGQVLRGMAGRIDTISEMSGQVAAAAEEQTTAVDEINRSVAEISEIAGRSAAGVNQVASASQELARLGGELQASVGRFRTG